jgi:hypothetical protein
MRAAASHMKIEHLKAVSLLLHIMWNKGNAADTIKLFYIKRKTIRIMAGSKRRVSCKELFRKSDVLTHASGFLCWLDICCGQQKNFRQLGYT